MPERAGSSTNERGFTFSRGFFLPQLCSLGQSCAIRVISDESRLINERCTQTDSLHFLIITQTHTLKHGEVFTAVSQLLLEAVCVTEKGASYTLSACACVRVCYSQAGCVMRGRLEFFL